MSKVILKLSNGEEINLSESLEGFKETYLDEDGFFKDPYIELELVDMKNEPSILIFTNQIATIQEEK